MSKPKKLLSLFLTLVLAVNVIGSIALVYAESIGPETTESTVTYSVEPVCYITIPSTMTVEMAYKQQKSDPIGQVAVENMHLPIGKCVTVSVNNGETLYLKNNKDDHKIQYSITDGSGNAFTTRSFTQNTTVDGLTLNIAKSEWDSATTGSYSGTATFNISYADIR